MAARCLGAAQPVCTVITRSSWNQQGGHEEIKHRTYKGVGFERLMSWKARDGRVSEGKIEMKPQKSDLDKEDEVRRCEVK